MGICLAVSITSITAGVMRAGAFRLLASMLCLLFPLTPSPGYAAAEQTNGSNVTAAVPGPTATPAVDVEQREATGLLLLEKANALMKQARSAVEESKKLLNDARSARDGLIANASDSTKEEATKSADAAIHKAESVEFAAANWMKEATAYQRAARALIKASDSPGYAALLEAARAAEADAVIAQGAYEGLPKATDDAKMMGFQDLPYDTDHFFIQAGFVSLAPYKIREDRAVAGATPGTFVPDANGEQTFSLDGSSDVDVNGFLEVRAYRGDLWDAAKEYVSGGSHTPKEGIDWLCRKDRSDGNGQCWFFIPREFDARFSFVFGKSSKPSASTITGSGDLAGSVMIGWPIVSHIQPSIHVGLSLETIHGFVTDRKVQDVHNRHGGGIGLNIAVPVRTVAASIVKGEDEDRASRRLFKMHLSATANLIETPNKSSNRFLINGRRLTVVETDDGFPSFDSVFAMAFDSNIMIPFGDQGYFVIGSSVMGGNEASPNPWSLQMGVTLPLDTLVGIITNPFKQ